VPPGEVSPTARSLRLLRERGAIAQTVERWNPGARRRVDLFGVIDIVALEPGLQGVLGIQACTTGDQSKRLAKILSEPRALAWIGSGCRLAIWGWSKKGARGKRKQWTLSETVITEEMWR
jgi:hypothetical protein